jgi:type I restriction enzyme S subunit
MAASYWSIVQDILQKHAPEYEVRAFGSRATGQPKSYSDLDLAIMTARPLTLNQLTELTDAFADSDLPWKVDIVDWASTDERFRDIIRRQSVVIQRP